MALRNVRVNVVKKCLRLEVDVWGKISLENINIGSVCEENNMSLTNEDYV